MYSKLAIIISERDLEIKPETFQRSSQGSVTVRTGSRMIQVAKKRTENKTGRKKKKKTTPLKSYISHSTYLGSLKTEKMLKEKCSEKGTNKV